jgi:glycosyltransferase involved in cell wall biosynthesis
MSLSVIVITRNEAHNIQACLQSVAWCDEIVVVDSGSTDETAALARACGAQVVQTADWPGYGPQKNVALSHARSDWVLSIDADERVTPALRDEILAAMASGTHDAYRLPRLSRFCGRFIRHAGWYPEPVLRLFRRGETRFSDDLVHERVVAKGSVGMLREPLMHYTYADYSEVLTKIDRYSTLGARQAFERGERATPWTAVFHGLWAFVRTYVFRAGFLDGAQGFGVALMLGEASYYKYIKLWYLHRDAGSKRDG